MNEIKNKFILTAFLILFCIITSYLIVFIDYEVGLFFIIVISGTCLLLFDPIYALYGVFFTANIFNPSIRISFVNIYASNALIILAFVFLVFNKLIGKKKKLLYSTIDLPMIFFIIYIFSSIKLNSISIQSKRVMAYVVFSLMYFVSLNILDSREKIMKMLRVILFSSFAGSLIIIYTFYFSRFRGSDLRGFGNFGNPNAAGQYLISVIPFLFYFVINKKNPIYKIMFFFISFSLMLTLSRASIFSLMISFVFMVTIFKKNYWYFLFAVICSAGVIFYPPVWERLLNIINLKDNSLLARITLWGDALSQFADSPLFGIGVGKFMGSALPYDSKTFNIAFNMFITILTENGVTGLLLYLWIWAGVFFSSFRFYFNSVDIDFSKLSFFVIISLIAINIMSLAEDPIVAIMANWVTGFNFALIFLLRSYSIENPDNISHISSN